jgi:hypothetical protein
MLPPPLPMMLHGIRRKFVKGYALDIRTLEASLRENCGDYTFQVRGFWVTVTVYGYGSVYG